MLRRGTIRRVLLRTTAQTANTSLHPLGLLFKGRDAVAAQYQNSYASFPDLETTVDGDAAGPSSYTHWGRLRGTMIGQFMGLPPTGKKMDTRLVALYDIVDDHIVRETVHFDLEEFCSQLGLDVQTVRDRAKATSAAMASVPSFRRHARTTLSSGAHSHNT